MRSPYSWAILLWLCVVTACSRQPSPQELAKQLDTVDSWAATAHMVGDSWLQGHVPPAYVKHTLQKTESELQHTVDTLETVAPPQQRMVALQQVHRIQQTVHQLAVAVEQQNRADVDHRIQTLAHQEQSLHTLIQTIGGSS